MLHNKTHRVHYDQKRQQEEGTRGIFSEGSREQAAPNIACCLFMPKQVATLPQLSIPKPTKTSDSSTIQQIVLSSRQCVRLWGSVGGT